MKTLYLGLAAALLVGACAQNPDSVSARYVSPNSYLAQDCTRLIDESRRLRAEEARVANQQRENAQADTALVVAGAIIFWPALIGLAFTRDQSEELARLRGEANAAEAALREKGCAGAPAATPTT